MADLFKNISILVAILGACVTLVAGLGLFGACCEVKCLLITVTPLISLVFRSPELLRWPFEINLRLRRPLTFEYFKLLDNYRSNSIQI